MSNFDDDTQINLSMMIPSSFSLCGSFINPSSQILYLYLKITKSGGTISGINTSNGRSSFSIIKIG